jgi:NADH-quinone oxidoreductase subunit G
VEEILRHFHGEVVSFDAVIWHASESKYRAALIMGGYPPRSESHWLNAEQLQALAKIPTLVVFDMFPGGLADTAKYLIPAMSWAEKDGTFVNHAGLAQAVKPAIRPTRGCRTDAQVLFDLLDRRGLPHAATLRAELAREIPYFASLADPMLDPLGIRLQQP